MSDKKQSIEEAEQVKTADESVKAPAKTKRTATRKRAVAPKTEPSAEQVAAVTPDEKSAVTENPAAEEITKQPKKASSTTPRKRAAGTRRSLSQTVVEAAAALSENTICAPSTKPEETVASEPEKTEPVQEIPGKEQDAKQEDAGRASVKQEAAKQEQPKAEQPKNESAKQAATLPVVELNDKKPVKTQTQRGIEPAVPLVNFAALSEQRRNFWGRVFLLFSVGLILAISVFIFIYRPTVYSAYSHSIRFLYNAEQNVTQVMYDGTLCEQSLPGEWTQSVCDSTGSVCAAAVGGKLYLVRGDDIQEISPSVQDFMLSQNGRTLVYRNAENQLHYVRLSAGLERYTVSRDCRDSRYCLSPDGEMLFYTYAEAKNGEEIKSHAAIFSLSALKPYFPKTVGIVPVAISNDFEHIFYFDESGDLYYMNEKSEISLCRRYTEGGMELLFDREFEELLLKDANGIMLWQDGEETMIPELRGIEDLTILPNQRVIFRQLPVGTQCLVHSFDKSYYLKKGTEAEGTRLAYLNGTTLSEVAFLSAEESHPVVTDKGVYYLEYVTTADSVRKHLYFCPLGKTTTVQLSWDVEDFCVNSDGSRILHVDHQGALYASRVERNHLDSVLISDFVDGALQDSSATDVFYYFVGEQLYASSNGAKPEQALAEGIDGVLLDVHTAIFFDEQGDSYTVYARHRNRKKLVQIASGITSIN